MIKTPTQARTAAALVLLSLVLVVASSAPLVSAADSWLQATYTPAVVAAPGALVPVVPAPHSITWATGPRVGTECNGLISNGTLPPSSIHDRICVSVRVGAGPYVDAYLSLYSRSKNTPIAVFFRLPDGGGQVSAPSRVSWPATGLGHINSWDPASRLVHITSTPGEWSDVKSFELADRTMTVEGYQTKVLQTRGHMASFAAFTGSQAKQQATMSYANAFPSFNSITGLAGTRYFDGNVWNARETATIALANTLAANALYVVVGTDFGEAIHRVLIDGAVPIRARPTFGNLYATASVVPVPARVWTAIYDSAGARGFAWICEHRDHRKGEVYHALYAPHGSATPTCTYVSIDQIAIDFGIDPFPGVAAGPARTNASPAGFAGVWNPPAARGNYHGLVNQPLPAGTILTGGKLFWW